MSLLGDFNLHINNTTNCVATGSLNTTESCNFNLHVSGATHMGENGTLGLDIGVIRCDDLLISKYKCIFFALSLNATLCLLKDHCNPV